MKRLIIVLSCISIFYAGAVWALEGCRDFSSDIHAAHHGEKSSHSHHDADTATRHTHSDSSKIHCPNILSEFLISPLVMLASAPAWVSHLGLATLSVNEFLADKISGGFGAGPPVSLDSKGFPLHLLLSVIRV